MNPFQKGQSYHVKTWCQNQNFVNEQRDVLVEIIELLRLLHIVPNVEFDIDGAILAWLNQQSEISVSDGQNIIIENIRFK